MEFMEIDSCEGPVKQFLATKLQTAKGSTTSLQNSIEVRQETLARLQKELDNTKQSVVNITAVSKKALHGDYILEIDITNDSNTDCYYNQCFLHWNSSEELQYATTCYPKGELDAPSRNIPSNSSAIVIIVIRRPTYNKRTTYAVNGVINNYTSIEAVVQTVLPLTTLNIHEFVDLKPSDIIRGDVLGLLTSYSQGTFETCLNNLKLCDFRHLIKCSVDKCVLYYADGISENVDGALLQQKGSSIIRVYTRDKNHLRNFIYYLTKTLGELHYVKDYHADFSIQCEGRGRKQFNAMLLKEVSVRNLINNIPQQGGSVVLRKRLDLIDLEYGTDRFVDDF